MKDWEHNKWKIENITDERFKEKQRQDSKKQQMQDWKDWRLNETDEWENKYELEISLVGNEDGEINKNIKNNENGFKTEGIGVILNNKLEKWWRTRSYNEK